jgi:glycosyltransferase involved in cell wall biosynthesis
VTSPRFSVLLPAHNRADVIGFAVRSVLSQTDGDFELLVVGDGCTDGTAAVVQGFADRRIRWFDLPKAPGFGYRNRNAVLRQAQGEFVAYMAHDDLLLPDHLQQLHRVLADDAIEWAYSRPLWVSRDGFIIPVCTNLTNDDELEHLKRVELFIPSSCIVYRRNCHVRYGMWPEHLMSNGDRDLWARMLKPGPNRNHAFLRTPTAFHFVANWRVEGSLENWPTTGNFLRLASASAWWPPCLKVSTSPDVPEQAIIFEAIERGGEAWIADVRRGIDRVIDRAALDHVLEGLPQLAATKLQLAQAVAERDSARHAITAERDAITAERHAITAERDAITAERDAIMNSRSWRLTRPLRALHRLLRKSGSLQRGG